MDQEEISHPAMDESGKDAEQMQMAYASCGMPRSIDVYYGDKLVETKLVYGDALKKSRQDNATLAQELRQSRNEEQLLRNQLEHAKSALKIENDGLKDVNEELKNETQGLRNENQALKAHMQDLNRAFHVLYAREPERERLETQLRMTCLEMHAMRDTMLSMEQEHSGSLDLLGIQIARAQAQITALREEQEPVYSEEGGEDGREDGGEDEGEDDAAMAATVDEPETTWTIVIDQ